MKKWTLAIVSFAFLIIAIYAVIQSNIGRNWIRSLLVSRLESLGYEVQIGSVEGTLPHQINLKEIEIQGDGWKVTALEIQLRPVLWRLLKNEAAFTNVKAKQISFNGSTPVDYSGVFRINSKRIFVRGEVDHWSVFFRYYRNTKDADFSLASDYLQARGAFAFSPLLIGDVLVRSPDFHGQIKIRQSDETYVAHSDWEMTLLGLSPVHAVLDATYKDSILTAHLNADNHAKATLHLKNEGEGLISGSAELDVENLQALHLPKVYGSLKAKASGNTNQVHIEGVLNDFYFEDLFAQTVSMNMDLNEPFKKISGPIRLSAQSLKWKYLELEEGSFETSLGEESAPYRLSANGKKPQSFALNADGSWQKGWTAHIDHLDGSFSETPFALNTPIAITRTEDSFRLPAGSFTVGAGSAKIDINRQKEDADVTVALTDFPLNFLSLNPLEVEVGGTLNLGAEVRMRKGKVRGLFHADVAQTAPAQAKGHLEGKFNQNRLLVKGELAVRDTPMLNLDFSFPIHFSLWPFESKLLLHKPVKGNLVFNGKIEEILDYFDLGPHRFEGKLQGALTFRNTLNRPIVKGQFSFENGFYENYYSGTILTNIQANFIGKNHSIYLRSFTAEDRLGMGTLTGNGKVNLYGTDHYPFSLDLDLKGLQFAEIDLVTAKAVGKVHLEGNTLSAIAKGNIEVQDAKLTIPDHIPHPLPDLQVTYRNPIHPIAPPQKTYQPYPLHLDLNVLAPSQISIEGRGLTSLWKGNFHLGGTYTQLATKGNLELIEGEFNFSSRSFKLIEGSLAFSGIEHQMPYLNLAGEMETKGITITARLKGPLDDPQITLMSNPPLPLGSIMSYLLFGQDISEIGGFQALQIATSLASLAGTGPDVMESTRKSLGVDRLRVVTEPTEEGGETVALQVSKYISKGVLVSFTQGIDESSTNISVEIELKNNFVFQIESDQRQEQGRFTLKWNLNY